MVSFHKMRPEARSLPFYRQKVVRIPTMSMKIAGWLTPRLIGGSLVLILAAPTAKAAATPWQDVAPAPQEQSAPSGAQQAGTGSGNGKPAADSAQSAAPLPDAPEAAAPEVAQSPTTGSSGSNGSSQPSQNQQQQDQQQNGAAQPVGTAAAPAVNSTGVSGSQVSGAAIAPAKQRRAHTILIRVAVIAAACVAVGIVVGLTRATPSQPR
jgi:hypothetical protein